MPNEPRARGNRPRSSSRPRTKRDVDPGLAARRAALSALDHVVRQKRLLAHLRQPAWLDPADAARAARLTDTVLRHLGPLDALLADLVERKPSPAIRMILRLGAAELLIAGEEAHGVVNAAVSLAKLGGAGSARSAGLVNAVLRRIAETGGEAWRAHSPQRLPFWIAGPVKKAYGESALRAIEQAHEKGAPLDITLKGPAIDIPGAERLSTGSLRLWNPGQVSALPGFATGDWWVQDAAAALPARLFGDVAGRRVLDLCAAPGGKTLQLAAMGGRVTALDLSETRLERLRENLARTGLEADVVAQDAFAHRGTYDAILLDAPCTATGTIRRHPDLPFVKSGNDTEDLTRLQMRLIDQAVTLLAPGGCLVFCTCSLLQVEGEYQVKAALGRHPDLRVDPIDPVGLGGDESWASPEGGLRLRPDFWPGRGGLDGFYMARLVKT